MKRFHILLAALLFAAGAAAQNPTAYFMEGSTLRMQFNPAFAPHRGYVNVPGAGGADFGLNSSLALDDILYPRDGQLATLLDPSVTTAEALRNIHDRNTLHAGGRVNLLGFGSYTVNRKHFWSFGIDLRVDAAANIPGKLLEFMKRGTDGAIRGLALNFDTYVDAGFSYSFPLLNDRLYIGAKAKFVMGLARMRMAVERMDVTLHDDRWAVDARTALDANIPGTRVDYRYDDDGRPYFGIGDIEPFANGFKPAGYGFAADLGATYDVLDELQVSLSVTDLGFIGWNRESSIRGHSETSAEYTGIVVENDEVSMSPDFSFDELTRFRPGDPEAGVRMLQATRGTAERAVQLFQRSGVQRFISPVSGHCGRAGPRILEFLPRGDVQHLRTRELVALLCQRAVLFVHEKLHQPQAVGRDSARRGLLDAALLDADVDKAAHQVRQVQIHRRLAEHQQDHRQREAEIGL